MKKVILKAYMAVALALVATGLSWGWLLPYLVSAESSELVALGFVLSVVLLPVCGWLWVRAAIAAVAIVATLNEGNEE